MPKNFSHKIKVYDEDTDKYILYQRIGNTDLFTKKIMTFQQYLDYQLEEIMKIVYNTQMHLQTVLVLVRTLLLQGYISKKHQMMKML